MVFHSPEKQQLSLHTLGMPRSDKVAVKPASQSGCRATEKGLERQRALQDKTVKVRYIIFEQSGAGRLGEAERGNWSCNLGLKSSISIKGGHLLDWSCVRFLLRAGD